ncbi:MAG TPA: T9SS type B sorting domain-containing protein, partial [Bacteroidia bacterium]|nr:T9SS type B sorting domain-containing protein [Bacteroidia bacterium]
TGAACADTLSITITKAVGVVPAPSFTADTTCTGQATNFINTSNPLGGPGVTFYWDFYSLGTFQDSVTNPVWSFNGPGTYFVKLYEVENGCGADTSMKIIVMPPPEAAITGPATDCHGIPITLTATGGGEYKWNTGATTSSITFVPTPADTSFFVRVTKGCSDTAFFNGIKIYPLKQVTACCDTTIHYGDTAALIASNNQKTYAWSPATFCDTCRITASAPIQNTTFTVNAIDSNGCKSADTVQILIETCGTAWIPNAFTPNHDGLNDVFAPKGQCILTYTMWVFNRWGTLIFKGDNTGWDGRVNGRMVQEDTYVYELIVTTNDKVKRNYIGRVTVIR